MELQWDTVLKTPEDVLRSLGLCGIDASACTYDKCQKVNIVLDHVARAMAGRGVGFDVLVNDIVHGCSLLCSGQCSTSRMILDTLNQSKNAYLSADGRKFWPDPSSDRPENRVSRFAGYQICQPNHSKDKMLIDSTVTMGSCFMNEINKLLASDNFLMRSTESHCHSPHVFPANWGTIFNPLSAQYALEWYFNERSRPEMLWRGYHSGTDCLYDVFREDVTFSTLEGFRENLTQHKMNAKRLLSECSSFVCAFSMTETWLTNDGSNYPLARAPWRINPLTARPYNLSVDEIKNAISRISLILHQYNKDCRIYVGVDPVPLHATHTHKNSIIADSNAKAALIAGITLGIQESDVGNLYYVPFYESIHYCMTNPWCGDERHLNEDAILKAYHELVALIR